MSTAGSVDSPSTVERLALAIQAQVLSGEVPVGTRLRQGARGGVRCEPDAGS